MENQFDDQPLKWIDRIKHGLRINKGYFFSKEILSEHTLRSIFKNIKERNQYADRIDLDVSFDDRQCLLTIGRNAWKLVVKKSRYCPKDSFNSHENEISVDKKSSFAILNVKDSPKIKNTDHLSSSTFIDYGGYTNIVDRSTDHFFSFIFKELNKIKEINKKLSNATGDTSFIEIMKWYLIMIKGICNCNKTFINIVKHWKINTCWRNWTKNKNIEKYKRNNSWIIDSEWNKLSLFKKIMTRWNFTDKHQCLMPWEEKKLSKQELMQFHEEKKLWRIKRKNELKGNNYQLEIFEKFCHARIINNKEIHNLDMAYDDTIESNIKLNKFKSNIKSNDTARKKQRGTIHAN